MNKKPFNTIVILFLIAVLFTGCSYESIVDIGKNAQDNANQMAENVMDGIDRIEGMGNKLDDFLNKENDKNKQCGPYKTVDIVAGNTFIIEMNGEQQQIHLLGIETPDIENTEEFLLVKHFVINYINGAPIYIEYDETNQQKDQIYAYIYTEKGVMINKLLLQSGYAKILENQSHKYKNEFQATQTTAKKQKIGLWGEHGIWE